MTQASGGAHPALRGLNGLALLAMVLVVGGIGAEQLQAGHIAAGLLLQVPLYGLGGLCWAVFTRGAWARRVYLPGFLTGAALTLILYMVCHADHARLQLDAWIDSLVTGWGAAPAWFFGPPAVLWLAILLVAAPLVTWLRCRAEAGESVGDFLLR